MGKRSLTISLVLTAFLLTTNVAGSAVTPGVSAPDFALPSLADGNQRISEYRSEVVFISFFSRGCLPCLDSVRLGTELHEQFGSDGLRVMAVAVSEDPKFARRFATSMDITYPVLLDTKGLLRGLYDFNQSSMTVVLDQEGRVIFSQQGFGQENAGEISALIAGLITG